MILDEIIARTRKRVARLPLEYPENGALSHASLVDAIRNKDGRNAIIAEMKCASPSRGMIRRNIDMTMMAGNLPKGVRRTFGTDGAILFRRDRAGHRKGEICGKYPGPAQGLYY
jgi:indole-3-glycerol phosphate synthase